MIRIALRSEMVTLWRLSLPAVLSQLGIMMMGLVDTMMVGRLGTTELAATALGNSWNWTWMALGLGLVLGIDPLISQAHGRGDGPATGLAFQRAMVLALLASVPIVVAQALTRQGLVLLGQEPEVASLAARYNFLKIPTIPCFLLYSALRQYLQGRGFMSAATWVVWIANAVHALLNWAFIFGHCGLPALGLEGAAIATSISTLLLLLGLGLWVRLFRLHAGAWHPLDGTCLQRRGLAQGLRLGLPVGAQLWLESCAFGLSGLMAGWIGREALASHQVVLNLAAFAFMVPLGISQGAATRVGNLLGAGDLLAMRRAARAALLLGASVMAGSAIAFVVLRFQLPRLYSEDSDVIALAAQIFPIAAAFQLWDGTQVVAGGVLRGMGRPDAAALANLIGYYAVALPIVYLLAFGAGFGLRGIWGALVLGLAVVAAALLIWVRRTARGNLSALRVSGAPSAASEPVAE
jgi:multidrug resistance protein, MATE family